MSESGRSMVEMLGVLALGRDGLVGVSDLINGWNGGFDLNDHNFTALGAALQSHLETGYEVWTSDDYGSCAAFVVNLSHGYVYDNGRNNLSHLNYTFAVCQ